MPPANNFLVIDDDLANNFICRVIIQKTFPGSSVTSFTSPVEAVEHIKEIGAKNPQPTVILLDINMPVLSGWQVLEIIDKLDDDLKNLFSIYMLSSSINPKDNFKANAHPLVVAYLEKPLTKEMLTTLTS